MPVIEPVVSEEKVRQLLDEQHESELLDYKTRICLDEPRDVVELAKDVGAMQIDGGFIIAGADSHGVLTNELTERDVTLLDEATVRPKLAKYLPEPFEIRCAHYIIDGKRVAIVYVAPNPDGFSIFKATANHDGRPVFRAGEVYARHGTSSEPWRQADIKKVFEKQVAAEKQNWRYEFASYIEQAQRGSQTQNLSRAPVSTLTWQLDEENFIAIIVEQLRLGDTIPFTLLINRIPTEAKALLTSDRAEDFLTLLDRLTCLAALFLNLDKPKEFGRALDALNRIYDIGLSQSGEGRSDLALKASKLWLEIIRRVYALGALAVRRDNWNAVRSLIIQRPRGLVRGESHNNWLRHTLTMASRAGDFHQQQDGKQVEVPLLSLCQQTALHNACLSEDVDEDSLLDSVVQFDVFFNLVALSSQTRTFGEDYYPNFSRFYSHRSDPAFRRIVEDKAVREALLISDGDQLAALLRKLFKSARQESFRYSGWDGVFDRVVITFLDEHPEGDSRTP